MDWMALIALLLPLLKSLVEKERASATAGFDGPMTVYLAALAAGKEPQEAFKAFCECYVRCCELPK